MLNGAMLLRFSFSCHRSKKMNVLHNIKPGRKAVECKERSADEIVHGPYNVLLSLEKQEKTTYLECYFSSAGVIAARINIIVISPAVKVISCKYMCFDNGLELHT